MYLKRLEISGFKSFADKTEVNFEKGVTCVVGPNGCGKSNISDAIRWVLGERSAKLLRGAKMEDVIFHGTDFRKAVNFAEVSLTIDNTDRALPIEYQEIVIARRLYRTGESEYLLNKTLCRLKDIQNLILDTGIGSSSYSMIEQGRIDYILSAEAEERRFLIEEAAGISKYKVKKDEAVRKLEATEQNLLRLNDIVTEVERNIRYAERQAKRAEKYKEHYEKLKQLELVKLSKLASSIETVSKNVKDEQEALQIHARDTEESAAALQTQISSVELTCSQLEEQYYLTEQRKIELEQKLISMRQQKENARERFLEAKVDIEKFATETNEVRTRAALLEKEIHIRKQEFEQVEKREAVLIEESSRAKNALDHIDQAIVENSMKLVGLREQNFEIASQLADIRNKLSHINARKNGIEEKKLRLHDLVGRSNNENSSCIDKINQIKQEIETTSQDADSIKSEIKHLQERKSHVITEMSRADESIQRAYEEVQTLKGKLDVMSQVDSGDHHSVRELVERHGNDSFNITALRPLLELARVEEGFEVALASALTGSLRAIVADDTKTAVKLIKLIRSSGIHEATVLIRNTKTTTHHAEQPSQENPSQTQTRLITKLHIAPGYEPFFESLIGNVYVIDDLHENSVDHFENAASGLRFVTKQGICFEPGTKLYVRNGSLNPIRDILLRQREKGVLKQQIDSLSLSISEQKTLKDALTQELSNTSDLLAAKSEHLVQVQMKRERLEANAHAVSDQVQRHHQECDLYDRDLAELMQDDIRSQNELEKLSADLTSVSSVETENQKTTDELHRYIEKLKQDKETQLLQYTKAQMQLDSHSETTTRNRESLNIMITSHESDLKRLSSLADAISSAHERIEKFEQLSAVLQQEESVLENQVMNASVLATQKKNERNAIISTRDSMTRNLNELREKLTQVTGQLHEHEKKIIELEHQKSSAIERIRNSYNLEVSSEDLKNAEDSATDETLSNLEQTIEELRSKVSQIGTVNLLAIDEYDELKQRFDFLSKQKKDLEESRDSLLEAIRKINRTTKTLFENTFTQVRQLFQTYFRLLFQGGDADLILVDEQNPLDSGIDMIARPPGKKYQHISLLSGGEKALTAIALLFALFKVKPSPFCVLDEVDAPLDEANNERFLRVLKEFLSHTQFIIVTHNRKTISMGDTLYGVTMEEAGISKLVSVRISKNSWTIEHSDEKVQKELNAILQ